MGSFIERRLDSRHQDSTVWPRANTSSNSEVALSQKNIVERKRKTFTGPLGFHPQNENGAPASSESRLK
jgi:hypothetical protein